MPDSDLNQATSLSSQVSQYLWEYISREKLRPGDDVLSEMQIGRDLGISRTTVREAYRSLAAVGILEIGNGRRPRLLSLNSNVLAQVSYRQVMETRRSIEVQTAQLAAIRATDEQKLSLKSHIAAMRDAMDDHQRRVSADLALHQELAEASHNPVNRLLLDALQNPLMESLLVDLGSQRTLNDISRIIDAHENIVNRICDGDAVAAGNAMYSHFELSASIGSPT